MPGLAPHGNPLDPVTDDEVVDKFRALTARVMSTERARAIEDAVLTLPEADDIASLVALLLPSVGAALR